jgi:hypothetical protein
MLRLCGTDLKETQWGFKNKFLLGESNVTETANNTNNKIVQQINNKLTNNHTALNVYTSVQNLRFCSADTLSYKWKWFT